MFKIPKNLLLPFLVLFFVLFGRALLLEWTNLIDPTEARYASVAAEMLAGNDWVTPMLPMPEGLVPYLGKPPFHFWMTAISYKLFGIEEWTSRLPSFISSILLLVLVYKFAANAFGEKIGVLSCLVMFSSAMFFFLAGASVTDMTLTALVSVSVIYLYWFLESNSKKISLCMYSSIFAACAFLCKGPIALILIMLPFLMQSIATKDFSWMKKFPWIRSIALFLAIITPWFIISELRNPGFIKYFFWNENIARYLFKEYGDKYGSGHTHMYGMSWVMMLMAFCPWTVVLVLATYRNKVRGSWEWLKADKTRLFVFFWGITAAFFFTFVKQLHGMYVLPCIPGLAILTACICTLIPKQEVLLSFLNKLRFTFVMALAFLGWGIVVAGAALEFNLYAIIINVCITLLCIYAGFKFSRQEMSGVKSFSLASAMICGVYFLVITSLSPHLDEQRSTSEILEEVAVLTMASSKVPVIGISIGNAYSAYWTARAWENELSRELKVEYVNASNTPSSDIAYLIYKGETSAINKDFEFVKKSDKYFLYKNKKNL